MNEHPTPYEPKRRSRVTVVKGASEIPVTLTHLVKGMVTGTLGNVPLTSAVYAQIPLTEIFKNHLIATVVFDNKLEFLGITGGHVYRVDLTVHEIDDSPYLDSIPHLILTKGATR